MKYALNIARDFGTNTIKTLFIQSFDNQDQLTKAIESMSKALADCNCLIEISTIERDDWKITHIIFGDDK